jgi:hypothetical protein
VRAHTVLKRFTVPSVNKSKINIQVSPLATRDPSNFLTFTNEA